VSIDKKREQVALLNTRYNDVIYDLQEIEALVKLHPEDENLAGQKTALQDKYTQVQNLYFQALDEYEEALEDYDE